MPKITLRRESTKHKVELSIWINGDRHCEFTGYLSGRAIAVKARQRRCCKACGYTQDRRVSTVEVV